LVKTVLFPSSTWVTLQKAILCSLIPKNSRLKGPDVNLMGEKEDRGGRHGIWLRKLTPNKASMFFWVQRIKSSIQGRR
jgi:hypothetical protein